MNAHSPSMAAFVLRTLLWLPACFVAWYLCAPYHATLVGMMARLLLGAIAPGIVSAVELAGSDLAFVTTLEVRSAGGQAGVLVPEVNPLVYTYGLALFLAMMLAVQARWWQFAVGAMALLPFQGWGVAFDFLVQVEH